MFSNRLLFILLFSFLPELASAVLPINDVPLQDPAPFATTSYLYGSYNYLVRSPYFISGQYDRVNDIARNGLRLQQAFLSVGKFGQGVGGYFDVAAGLDAYNLAPAGWNANMLNLDTVGLVVPAAYLQYRYQNLTVKVGEMVTLAGWESYIYTKETSFSRSIVDGYAQPGSHIGVRVVQQLTDTLSFYAGLINGWSTIEQPGRLHALELGGGYRESDRTLLIFNIYSGPTYLTDGLKAGPTSIRRLLDVYGSYQLTRPLSLAFNFDYGVQPRAIIADAQMGRAVWAGLAAYVNYDWTEQLNSSLRVEVFNDGEGYRTGVRQVWKEVTLTLSYLPVKYLTVRGEIRHDFTNVPSFIQKNGIGTNNHQQSYSLSAMYTLS